MSRILFARNLRLVDWTSDVIRCFLERSTSAYTPDIDDQYLDAFTGGGGVEISVASYSRQTIASPTEAYDATKNQLELSGAAVAFGNLESGQTVKAVGLYRQIGGDDTTPANDELLLYDDGKVDVVLAADVAISGTTLWVEPLEANLPNGTALDFGGGKTCSLTVAASRGDRELSVTNIAAAADAGDRSEAATDSILAPSGAILQNGPFNINPHADGLMLFTQRGLFAA